MDEFLDKLGKRFLQSFFETYFSLIDLYVLRHVSSQFWRLLRDHCVPLRLKGELLENCIQYSSPSVFTFLGFPRDEHARLLAVRYGRLDMVKKIGGPIQLKEVRLAAENGHMELLDFFESLGIEIGRADLSAANAGHLHILVQLEERGYDLPYDEIFRYAINADCIAILEWCVGKIVRIDQNASLGARSIRMFDWLVNHGYLHIDSDNMVYARNNEIRYHLHKKYGFPLIPYMYERVIDDGDQEFLEYLLKNSCSPYRSCVNRCITQSRLDMLKRIHEAGYFLYFTTDELKFALENDEKEIAEFMKSVTPMEVEPPTKKARVYLPSQ
jgi:hypothetical protein